MYLVPTAMRQKTNMFILSCCWQAPQHVSLSVYMNAGREFICILSVQTNILTGYPSISWVISASQLIWMLKTICDAFTVRQIQFLGLTYSQRSTWSRSFSAHLVTSSSFSSSSQWVLFGFRFSAAKTKAFMTQNRKAGSMFQTAKKQQQPETR